MTGAPITSPTLPRPLVRLVGSARPRQKLLPSSSCAGTAAPQTISRVARSAQATLGSSRGRRSASGAVLLETATSGPRYRRAAMGDWSDRRLHLVGIGGAGMSAYALVSAQLGATVSGSDRADSPALERLRAAGVGARAGDDAAHGPARAGGRVAAALPPRQPPARGRAGTR